MFHATIPITQIDLRASSIGTGSYVCSKERSTTTRSSGRAATMMHPSTGSVVPPPTLDDNFGAYKKWVLSTYGDGSKTKTISW